jgi:hypothetical protein
MSERWSGLYLKAELHQIAQALLRISTARGYSELFVIDRVEYPILEEEEVAKLYQSNLRETVELAFLAQANPAWTRVIGIEKVVECFPRLYFASELAFLLSCDAFECGFLDSLSWWYCYYEGGLPADRFDSLPEETYWQPDPRQPLDPNDSRTVYLQALQHGKPAEVVLPGKVLAEYRGRPSRLASITRPGQEQALSELTLSDCHPMSAVRSLRELLTLPWIGSYLALDLFTELANHRRPPSEATMALIGRGLAFVALQHPKVSLLNSSR